MIDLDRETRKIRRKQEHCNHPSWMCPICHLYQDNMCICNYIDYLHDLLEQNEIPYNTMQILRPTIDQSEQCEEPDMLPLQDVAQQN